MLTARKKVLQTVGGRSSVISSRDKPRISRNSEEKKKESQENVESLATNNYCCNVARASDFAQEIFFFWCVLKNQDRKDMTIIFLLPLTSRICDFPCSVCLFLFFCYRGIS
jgi:hypothetical protein